jgi:hypothetical protein
MQLGNRKINWQSLFWISLLLLPTLGAIWFGLNFVRVKTYDYAADYQRHLGDFRQTLFSFVVKAQDSVVWVAVVDMVLCPSLAAITVSKRILRRKTEPRSISK